MTQDAAFPDGTLIMAAALAQGVHAGGKSAQVDVESITCLDPKLRGHDFKYAGNVVPFAGVHPFRIAWRAGDERHVTDAMVKAKPSEAAILAVYGGLLSKAGIALRTELASALEGSDYSVPNLKEAILFRDFYGDLAPLLPASLGVYLDEGSAYALRLEGILPAGSVILSPDDDTTRLWRPGFGDLVLDGLARLHARFLGKTDRLCGTGFFHACERATMVRGAELWAAFLDFLRRAHPDLGEDNFARHQRLLDTLADWYAEVDDAPKSLLYGDVNPQNIAFAREGDGFRLCLFDWERATISPPHRDVAEHLVYTLGSQGLAAAQVQIDTYLAAFARHAGQPMDPKAFRHGLRLMLQDLLINRLPLMIIVHHVTGKRPGAVQAYRTAHRLLQDLS